MLDLSTHTALFVVLLNRVLSVSGKRRGYNSRIIRDVENWFQPLELEYFNDAFRSYY